MDTNTLYRNELYLSKLTDFEKMVCKDMLYFGVQQMDNPQEHIRFWASKGVGVKKYVS